jgi:hypothetical protein
MHCITIGLLGHGENRTTGDFSRGVQGVWIENGQLDLLGRRDYYLTEAPGYVPGHGHDRQRPGLAGLSGCADLPYAQALRQRHVDD